MNIVSFTKNPSFQRLSSICELIENNDENETYLNIIMTCMYLHMKRTIIKQYPNASHDRILQLMFYAIRTSSQFRHYMIKQFKALRSAIETPFSISISTQLLIKDK